MFTYVKAWIYNFPARMLSSTQLMSKDVYLVTSQQRVYLFAVPTLVSKTDLSSGPIVSTSPFWIHLFSTVPNAAPYSGSLFPKNNGVICQSFLYLLTEFYLYALPLSFLNAKQSTSIFPYVGLKSNLETIEDSSLL